MERMCLMNIVPKIYLTTDTGQVVGAIWSDNVLRIEKQASHYVKIRNLGYGVSPRTFAEAKSHGSHEVEIIAHDRKRWRVAINDYEYYATHADIGGGEQLFMTKRSLDWLVKNKPTYRNQPLPSQMSLFEGEGGK
jgi:hypothetical protein